MLERDVARVQRRIEQRDLFFIRRDAERVVAEGREAGQRRTDAGADVEQTRGRFRQTFEQHRRRAFLRLGERFVRIREKAVVQIRHRALLERQDVHENVEWIVEVAVRQGHWRARYTLQVRLHYDPLGFQDEYKSAAPFPHIVLDGLFDDADLDAVLAEFPSPDSIK